MSFLRGCNRSLTSMGAVGNQTTELSRKGVKGAGEWAHDPNHVTQHQVRAGRGF